MFAYHVPASEMIAARRAAFAIARRVTDSGPRDSRGRSFASRINRALFSGASRVTFRSPELEALNVARERRIRCEIFQENAGAFGRAVFA